MTPLADDPLTADFLRDPTRWSSGMLTLRRVGRNATFEIGYLFPGEPRVYLGREGAGACYRYPEFEAVVGAGWRLADSD